MKGQYRGNILFGSVKGMDLDGHKIPRVNFFYSDWYYYPIQCLKTWWYVHTLVGHVQGTIVKSRSGLQVS